MAMTALEKRAIKHIQEILTDLSKTLPDHRYKMFVEMKALFPDNYAGLERLNSELMLLVDQVRIAEEWAMTLLKSNE